MWLLAEQELVCMRWACLGVPLDDVVGSGTQVKDRLALVIKQHSLGWHEACHHNEEAAIRRPLSIMNGPILQPHIASSKLTWRTMFYPLNKGSETMHGMCWKFWWFVQGSYNEAVKCIDVCQSIQFHTLRLGTRQSLVPSAAR